MALHSETDRPLPPELISVRTGPGTVPSARSRPTTSSREVPNSSVVHVSRSPVALSPSSVVSSRSWHLDIEPPDGQAVGRLRMAA
ncbi:hypothetical protein [Streptomyces sp. NPDC093109]|uniref:hypothetical protein n=1 Tax=Streptomyces sp. NPDC093109 TaxID=3154977 RepID=UPI00345096A6